MADSIEIVKKYVQKTNSTNSNKMHILTRKIKQRGGLATKSDGTGPSRHQLSPREATDLWKASTEEFLFLLCVFFKSEKKIYTDEFDEVASKFIWCNFKMQRQI